VHRKRTLPHGKTCDGIGRPEPVSVGLSAATFGDMLLMADRPVFRRKAEVRKIFIASYDVLVYFL
jgi:hypothetical protein